ncbi:hypothetical protein HFN68_02605 [Rhizobium laguerreae]|uniref:hypothetical protein n=1 Tax=Rhizobium laguerreae TaxID=1076926 RepID=UPI001C905022|nr:hypothetical protein [Rhizobium laguerreae]MBY3531839.1 hypothetical protein [Rhizobium laguerreae]
MNMITMGIEEPWFKDPGVADMFGGKADVETIEGTNIVIRIDDEILDLVELTVARFHDDGEWVWDTPDAYGWTRNINGAKEAAMKHGWSEALLRLREVVPSEVVSVLDNIARMAAAAVRN